MSDRCVSKRGGFLLSLTALSLFLLLVGCSADLAVISTPISGQLFQREELEAAREEGIGRVIVVAPGDPARPGVLTPGIGRGTTLLLMPDVAPGEIAATEARRSLRFRLQGEEPGEDVLFLDRRRAFERLGELVAEEVAGDLAEGAETVTLHLFALQGSGGRVEEMRALLRPLRSRLPPEAIKVEEVATGFTVAAIEERLREARRGDPILLFLGSAGADLLPQAAGADRLLVTEALFVPPEAEAAEAAEPGDLLLLGLDPLTLFEAALVGEAGVVEASLYRLPNPFPEAGIR